MCAILDQTRFQHNLFPLRGCQKSRLSHGPAADKARRRRAAGHQCPSVGDAISYFSTVLSLDPFCVSKKTDADRFGRLLDVWENQTSWSGTFVNKITPACSIGFSVQPTYQTTYTYDALDDLQTVSQSGLSPRTFTYDTLKRLVQAKNPESNTISYSYDGSNNLAIRKDLVRTLTLGAYDGMNRVTSKTYNDGITSPVSYTYDTGNCNALGRLVSVMAGNFVNNYTCYDTMGRIKNSSQMVGSTPYPFSYTYDISGALATETYPSGRVVTNAFDAAGRISGITGSIAPAAYASSVTYAPQGPVSGLNLGSGMTEAWTFNSREQPITLQVTTAKQPLSLGWGYGAAANNNGNVQSQTISGPGLPTGTTLTQNYTYDAVNRLWTFTETGGAANQNYNYDAFGNRWLTSSWIAPGMLGQTPTSDAFVNNQWGLNGVNGYDLAGNQTSIAGVNRTSPTTARTVNIRP
ncbi:MAG: hypothetical protein ABSH09_08960 [Bryobacteraceae bacterium]